MSYCHLPELISDRLELTIEARDQHTFTATLLQPATTPVAMIQILHGMTEHCGRYQFIATRLLEQGLAVLVHNHRGHGERRPLGYFADHNGWGLVVDDARRVAKAAIPHLPPQIPKILLGHSMGSFLAQQYAMSDNHGLDALILSGSNYQSPLMYHIGRLLARLLKRFQGPRKASAIMSLLVFGSYNRRIKDRVSLFDWLSRDPDQVQRYLQDPLCGKLSTLQFWIDFFDGLIAISHPEALRQINSDLSILILAGDNDPVGRYGKGLLELHQQLQGSGHQNVSCLIYPGGRHEMLNETNRDEVAQDLLTWLQRLPQLTKAKSTGASR